MDHTYQSTMLMPASYAVLSEEEMTYLAVAVLDILDQQIGQKQKGQHLGGIHQGFAQNIQKQFHK